MNLMMILFKKSVASFNEGFYISNVVNLVSAYYELLKHDISGLSMIRHKLIYDQVIMIALACKLRIKLR